MWKITNTHPFDNGHFEVEYLEEGSGDPDVDDGDEGEDEGPDQGHGDGQEGRADPVQPQLGLAEQDKGQPPDGLEALGRSRLGQHVVEVDLQKRTIDVVVGVVRENLVLIGSECVFGPFSFLHVLKRDMYFGSCPLQQRTLDGQIA